MSDIQKLLKEKLDALSPLEAEVLKLRVENAALVSERDEWKRKYEEENSEFMTYIRDTGGEIYTEKAQLKEWADVIHANCGEGENFNNSLYEVAMEMREQAE